MMSAIALCREIREGDTIIGPLFRNLRCQFAASLQHDYYPDVHLVRNCNFFQIASMIQKNSQKYTHRDFWD